MLDEQLPKTAQEGGVDVRQVKDGSLQVEQQAGDLRFKYGQAEVSVPAPSEEAVESWVKQCGAARRPNRPRRACAAAGGTLDSDRRLIRRRPTSRRRGATPARS
jgi:hypothetical protein